MSSATYRTDELYDVIGIGIGPFNLGLAALLEKVPEVKSLFLEKKPSFNWHPDMLIEGTTLQVPFFADLVSMVDVKSEYSFLNYLQTHNRLYHFYFLEKFHIPRKEYNHYCRWVSEQLEPCQFGVDVQEVMPYTMPDGDVVYEVSAWSEDTQSLERYLTRHIVMGIGSVPTVPASFEGHLGKTVFHTSDYLSKKDSCKESDSVVVIGSGQSAAEVFLDVAKEQEESAFSLQWFTRSQGFFPMEYSKLGLEYFSPEYTDFFYELPQKKKDTLIQEQDLLYKGISTDTIADIYDHLYERSIGGDYPDIHLQAMTEITGIDHREGVWRLKGYHRVNEEYFETEADTIILGTGYQPTIPRFLSSMEGVIEWDEKGRYRIHKDYRLKTRINSDHEIFVQNGELHTHGVGAPDLGLGAHRNAIIINQIAGREVYPVQSKNVFQTFGTSGAARLSTHMFS